MQIPATRIVAAGSRLSYAWVREEYSGAASVVGGGGSSTTGSWLTRVLNTVVLDADGILSLSANQITLAAGSYWVRAWGIGVNSNGCQGRLQNVTDATTVALGNNVYQGPGVASHSLICGSFTIAAGKALEIQTRHAAAQATYGLGWSVGLGNTGDNSVFCTAEFWKTA